MARTILLELMTNDKALMTKPHPLVGESVSPVVLADHEARPVDLAELWRRQPIAFFFLRHFG
jgi:hypothetical protein